MILRRLSKSLQEQNWTAIWIEFVLLVVGVFLGIQVANWNAARVDRMEYEAALGRLGAEIDINLAALDAFDPEIAKSLKIASRALTVCNRVSIARRIIVLSTKGSRKFAAPAACGSGGMR